MRVVLDTNVVISALLFGGPPRQLLDFARGGELVPYTSEPLLDELVRVLSRSKFAERLAAPVPAVTPSSLVQQYKALCTVVAPVPIDRVVPTDADDDRVVATAVAARAEVIVTGDSDLLSLQSFAGIRILRSAEARDTLQNRPSGSDG